MSVRKQIAINGIANLLSKAVRVADQLLLVPFFLLYWGAEYYGEWLTLSAIPSVLAFADFGIGTAACNSFVLYYSAGRIQESADCYVTGARIITISVIIGIIICSLVMFGLWEGNVLEKCIIDPKDATEAILLLMSSRLIGFYNQLYEAFYRSRHKAALSINLMTIEGLSKIGIGMTVLFLGYGIVAYSLSQFVIALVFVICYALGGKFLIKDIPTGRWDKLQAQSIVKKGLAYFISPIWQSIYFQGSTLVVRTFLGAEAVAVFNTMRTLSRSVNQIYSIINGSVFPELQIAIGEGKNKLAQRLFVTSMHISWLTAIVGIIVLAIFGLRLYNWWTQNVLDVSEEIWYLFLIGVFFNAMWWTASVVFRATNQPYLYAVYCIASALVSLLLCYILSLQFGMLGAVIGYVSLDIIMAILVLPTSCKRINVAFADLIRGKH